MLSKEAIENTRNYFLAMCDEDTGPDASMLNEVCDAALRSLSEPPGQGATPRTDALSAKHKIGTLSLESAQTAYGDMRDLARTLERELAQMASDLAGANYWRKRHSEDSAARGVQSHEHWLKWKAAELRVSELEAAIAPAIAKAERADRLGADKLRSTEINAQYWLEGGRRTANRGEAALAVEQAMNAYKNAAYGLAEDLAKAEAKLAEAQRDAERLDWMIDNPHEAADLLESWDDDIDADADDFREAIDSERKEGK